jgi:hypothetical protein
MTESFMTDDGFLYGADRWIDFASKEKLVYLPSVYEMTRGVEAINNDEIFPLDVSGKDCEDFLRSDFYNDMLRDMAATPFETFSCECDSHYLLRNGVRVPRLRTADIIDLQTSDRDVFAELGTGRNRPLARVQQKYEKVFCPICGQGGQIPDYQVAQLNLTYGFENISNMTLSIECATRPKLLRGLRLLETKTDDVVEQIRVASGYIGHDVLGAIPEINASFFKLEAAVEDMLGTHDGQAFAAAFLPILFPASKKGKAGFDDVLYLVNAMEIDDIIEFSYGGIDDLHVLRMSHEQDIDMTLISSLLDGKDDDGLLGLGMVA